MTQEQLDAANAAFWTEPCGTWLARRTNTVNNLAAFDAEYFKLYPFLVPMLDKFSGDVLEAGTGYGTVASYLGERCNYVGLDIAQGPRDVLYQRGLIAIKGSVLDMYMLLDDSYDGVVCMGVLHHTGNIPRGLAELRRVLKPGGRGLFMLYNKDTEKPAIDRNTSGENAPHTEYTNVSDIPQLFREWSSFTVNLHNGIHRDIYIEAIK